MPCKSSCKQLGVKCLFGTIFSWYTWRSYENVLKLLTVVHINKMYILVFTCELNWYLEEFNICVVWIQERFLQRDVNDRQNRVMRHTRLFSNHLCAQTLPAAVNSPTSSKKKKKALCSLPKKTLCCHWSASVTGHFQEFVVASHPRIPSNAGLLPGTAIYWPSAKPHTAAFTPAHTHRVTLCTHARPCTCTLLGNMRVTHTLRRQPRGLIGAGGGQAGFLPVCRPPIGAASAINTVVTGSS